MGNATQATSNRAIAIGDFTQAHARSAVAMGNHTQAISFAETALGTYNTLYTFTDSLDWNINGRLFVIGNGLDENSRSDAFSILKNGNIALNGTVTIDSAYTLPSTDGSAGQILATDGSGTANWTSNTLLQDTDSDTKIQVEESADEDFIRFDLAGTEYFKMDSFRLEVLNSNNSVFLGEGAGTSSNASMKNVGIGYKALSSINGAHSNVAIGSQALMSQVTGFDNVAIGERALINNISGFYNVAIGEATGFNVETGRDNVFIGDDAADKTTADISANVFIGRLSGRRAEGDSSVFIGYQSGLNETASQRLYIENSNADATGALIYGEFDNDLVRINGDLEVTGSSNLVPIGTIIMWPSEIPPAGWIPCNGQPFVRSTYPELFDILGDTGDGTANVPNFRGRFPLGLGQSQTQFSTNHAIKSTGGFEKHQLDITEMPPHTHDVIVTFDEGQENGSNNRYSDLRGGDDESKTYTSNSAGGSNGTTVAHNNMPPFYTINFIIKAE
ncbi:MAG: tail fiber protein [Bacteroidota bacterium]